MDPVGEFRRASMPVMTRDYNTSAHDDNDPYDVSNYDAEIKNLQKTLKDLGIGKPRECYNSDVRPKLSKTSAANRQSRARTRASNQHSEDYVPDYLVSPCLKHKTKGHLRVKDDVEDTGVVSPRFMLSKRRQSDPGRVTLSNLKGRSTGISSDSSEDEDSSLETRSPRTRSPHRYFSSLPEDETFPSSQSPRRRFLQSRHVQSLPHPEESPRRMRRGRSNSLPLPERTGLGVGEAVGALANLGGSEQMQYKQQMLKRSRCISIEESPLEEEEEGQKTVRRFSVL